MLPPGTSPGSGRLRSKKMGKGKGLLQVPAPKKIISSGGPSKLPQQQTESKEIFIDKDGNIDLPHDIATDMLSKAFIKVMEEHFANSTRKSTFCKQKC
jgi:hypothetical protein